MKNKKKIALLSVLSVLGFTLITAGVTYAFFSYIGIGLTENTIEAGTVKFIYEEVNKIGNGISITDALPVDDSEGKQQAGYFEFKVTSSSGATVKIPYEITTRIVEGSDNLADYVKVYLTKVSGNTENQVALSIYDDLDDSTNRLAAMHNDKTLWEDAIPAGVTNFVETYRLRMWLNNDTTDGQVLNYSPSITPASCMVGGENKAALPAYSTQAKCEAEGGEWTDEVVTYPHNDQTFAIKVNVYADGEAATAEEIAGAASASLSTVVVNGDSVTENTDTTLNYDLYAELESETTQATITVTPANQYANISITPITLAEANQIRGVAAGQKFPVQTGDNYFKVTVTSQDRTNTEEYVLKVKVINDIIDATQVSYVNDLSTLCHNVNAGDNKETVQCALDKLNSLLY